ncbi:MAG: 8-amino-7-oxononanoate synthase [Endomicrobiales bacterium]|nr:8-amino-7-oxononanoate synthase [Endomicrobiales bacterium]
MKEALINELNKIKSRDLYRKLNPISSAPDKFITISGKKYINFSSNNYLGLANHPGMKKAAVSAVEKYGCGGTSSRLVAGTLDLHLELEEKLAKFKNKEAALVYPTGFQTNQGVICSLLAEGDCIIMDKLNHASLWDAAKLSRCRIFVYEHCSQEDLERILKRTKDYRRRLIVTDSVFSMDGDLAPLKGIAELAEKYNAWTMIDEAHAAGVFGENGRGLAEYFGVEDRIDIIMGTLSKAFGSQGGFVCGSKELINFLINKSRSFIYTTALSPVSAACSIEALKIIKDEPERRIRLLDMSKNLRLKLNELGFDTLNSESQIVPLLVGSVKDTLEISSRVNKKGVFVPAIRPPTVPEGKCRLRFSLMSGHTQEDIAQLIDSLK